MSIFLRRRCSLGAGLLFLCLTILGACASGPDTGPRPQTVLATPVRKVVVVGFRAAIREPLPGHSVRDPISGTVFMAEPVPQSRVVEMNGRLQNALLDIPGVEWVSPGQARSMLSSLLDSDDSMDLPALQVLEQVGRQFGADAVLAGHLYRWRERGGSGMAASRGASVACDLNLITPADGALVWRAKFDKTQTSLMQNVLDMGLFIKAGGRWLTAEELAGIGLEQLVADMPFRSAKGGASGDARHSGD